MNPQLHTLQLTDARLEPVAAKVLAGERLNAEDGLALYESHDLLAVGWLANFLREKKKRQRHLFQRQSSHQSHQRLRRPLQALRVRPFARFTRSLQLRARRDLQARR